MTITSDREFPLANEPDPELVPGTADVEWAERAYRGPSRSSVPPLRNLASRLIGPASPRRLRLLVGSLAVLATAAIVVLLTAGGAAAPGSSSGASRPPAFSPTTTGSRGAELAPPLIRTSPFVFPSTTSGSN